jgi:hypothetical protein
MKNLLFRLKAVKTGTHKAPVRAGAETFESRSHGAGAETNSYGSATLLITPHSTAEQCPF